MKASLMLGFLLASLPGVAMANRLDVGEGEAGKDLVLQRGDLLMVTLPANPSTGYSWGVLSTPSGLLKQVRKSLFEPSPHHSAMVGVGGVQRWNFRAVAVGKVNLRFSYTRPWEHGVEPVRVISWPVIIRK